MSTDEDWKREQAMEAGMLHGIDAYNEVMGFSTEEGYEPEVPPFFDDESFEGEYDEDEYDDY